MPQVGKKHFAYDKAGLKAAKEEAKKTGKKLTHAKTKKRGTSDGYMPMRRAA